MPCLQCANGKWKYGENGRCQFDTLAACKAAAAAIHIEPKQETTLPTNMAKPVMPPDNTILFYTSNYT